MHAITVETSRAGHPMLFYDGGQCLHLPAGSPHTTVGAIAVLLMQRQLLCPGTSWQGCYGREFTPGFQPAAQNDPVHCVVDRITYITYRPAPHPASRQHQPHRAKDRLPARITPTSSNSARPSMTTAKFSAWRHDAADSSETRFTMEMSPELVQAFNVLGYQTEPWYRAAPPAVVPPIPEDQLDEALDLMAEIISDETDETHVKLTWQQLPFPTLDKAARFIGERWIVTDFQRPDIGIVHEPTWADDEPQTLTEQLAQRGLAIEDITQSEYAEAPPSPPEQYSAMNTAAAQEIAVAAINRRLREEP